MLRVLDSTVLIDFLRGRPAVGRVQSLRARGDTAATTAINVEEIVRGLRPADTEAAHRLFRGLVVLDVRAEEAWQAGAWRRESAARGIHLFQADCLVAATAHLAGGVLITGNPKDFHLPNLQVEHWPVGT